MALSRGKPLVRRKRLESRSRLTSATPLQRTGRVKPVSDKRKADKPRRDIVREAVFERDGHRCRLAVVPGAGPCFGPLTFSHIRRASQGGAYSMANGVAGCVGHNCRLEDDPEFAAAAEAMDPPLVIRTVHR